MRPRPKLGSVSKREPNALASGGHGQIHASSLPEASACGSRLVHLLSFASKPSCPASMPTCHTLEFAIQNATAAPWPDC